jgi:hypothetical protein
MPQRDDIRKTLVLGDGPDRIGQGIEVATDGTRKFLTLVTG